MTRDGPSSAKPLLERVHERVIERTGSDVRISRIGSGENLVLVAADGDRLAGIAHRPPGSTPTVAEPTTFDAIDVAGWATAQPTKRNGSGAGSSPHRTDRTDDTQDGGGMGRKAIGIAALNALSDPLIDWQRGDPMAALGAEVDVVTMVGLFRPALSRFDPVELRVIERGTIEPGTIDVPDGVSVTTFLPDGAEEAFAGTDVAFITGSAFVYGGVDQYLANIDDDTTVVVIGATSSFYPEPLFEAGVDVVAGSLVTDAERVDDAIDDDVCTTDLYGDALEKVYVVGEGETGGLELDAQPE